MVSCYASARIRAHLLRCRPRSGAQRTGSTPRARPSGGALQLNPSRRSRRQLLGALFEGLTVALTMGNGPERLSVLLASPDLASRIAERENGQHVEPGGNVEQRVDLLEVVEADPVRAD